MHQDRLERPSCACVCTLGFGLAVVLHVGAEAMGLEIGWFSYYMLLLACCFLLPLPVVDRLATVFTWPARFLIRQTPRLEAQSRSRAADRACCSRSAARLLLVMVG